jgi:glycosyltransferase involved in cell wall biosynthesis
MGSGDSLRAVESLDEALCNGQSSRASSMNSRHQPIKVCLDISMLGEGYKTAQRAGIFRYTHHLAMALMATPDCQLSLCAGQSFELFTWTKRFLKTETDLNAYPFIAHPRLALSSDQAGRYLETIEHWSGWLHQRGITRTKKLKEALFSLRTPQDGLIGRDALAATDIYHSPYYAVPPEVKNSSLKSFVTIHDLIPLIRPDFFIKAIREQFSHVIQNLNRETWIICTSESTRTDLLNYCAHLDPAKVFVSHLAASEAFHPNASHDSIKATQQKYSIPTDCPYLLSLSTLEIRKNIAHLIRSFVALVSQEPVDDLCLVLAGKKGWLEHEVYSALEPLEPKLKERIIFTGYVEDRDLAALYKGAIAFVYPSLYEGFGLPPLEAMQCGTPVITANTASLPEVVGDAGLGVDPLDQDALAQAMLTLYSDTSLRADLATRSIQQAAKFSWQTCAQKTLDAYQHALHT